MAYNRPTYEPGTKIRFRGIRQKYVVGPGGVLYKEETWKRKNFRRSGKSVSRAPLRSVWGGLVRKSSS
jgi:hypothetical protein